MSLNGRWEFEVDQADTGLERGVLSRPLRDSILVPFAPESELSGVGNVDFLEAVWYRREIDVPDEWLGDEILLHFQAVDYDTTVWVNGTEVGRHRGGHTPFSFEISRALTEGRGTIVVRARDKRDALQPRGKQATWYANTEAWYTRTTGIWQTVWIEPVPRSRFERPRVTPDVANNRFHISLPVRGATSGSRVTVEVFSEGRLVAVGASNLGTDFTATVVTELAADDVRLWSPGDPYLYDLTFTLRSADGGIVDQARGYAGLRSIAIDGTRVLLNGAPVFQRLVLDQGYWPQSLMTAPSDAALKHDIQLGLAAGFNGARLHQKVFEERYLYHADVLGYLVWGEFPDWGVSGSGPEGYNQHPTAAFVREWLEVLERDYNHPSIIGWCPLNETHQIMHDRETVLDDVTVAMFAATKAFDLTRPVIDASGYSHRVPRTDIYDSHSYEQDPAAFRAEQSGLAAGTPFVNTRQDGRRFSVDYAGQPYWVSEFGGIWWNPDQSVDADSWGYGTRVRTEEEFLERFGGLVRTLLTDPLMFGYCYTQLTDVFQEQNGIYRFDRSNKLPIGVIHSLQSERAAIES